MVRYLCIGKPETNFQGKISSGLGGMIFRVLLCILGEF